MTIARVAHGMVAAIVVTGCACVAGAQVKSAEAVDPGLILNELRTSLLKGPVAERYRVSIKPPGRSARTDEMVVRVAPGVKPDRSDAVVELELGDLRVYASGTELVAVSTRDATSCFVGPVQAPLDITDLEAVLPPIPLPLVAVMLPKAPDPASKVSVDLTPYAPRVTWKTGQVVGASPNEQVVLVGEREAFPGETMLPEDAKVTMVIDARASRMKRLTSILHNGSELRIDAEPIEAGDPASWAITVGTRTRVASLADLKPKRGDAAAALVVPELPLMDSTFASWDVRSVFKPVEGVPAAKPRTHAVLVFVRETQANPFGTLGADGGAAVEALAQLAKAGVTSTGETLPEFVTTVVFVMPTLDDSSRRKVETAASSSTTSVVWSASPDRTIERFAPGAAAVAVVMHEDKSVRGVVVLDGKGAGDGVAQLKAELGRALVAPAPAVPSKDAPK